MIDVQSVTSTLRRKYKRNKAEILGNELATRNQKTLPVTVVIFKFTEKKVLNEGLPKFISWNDQWQNSKYKEFLEDRAFHWKSGVQIVPEKVVINSLVDWLKVINEYKEYNLIKRKAKILTDQHPELIPVIGMSWKYLLSQSTDQIKLMSKVLKWFMSNNPVGIYERQVPIPGIHTKWLDRRRKTIGLFLKTLQSSRSEYYQLTGILKKPSRIRIRVLCSKLRSICGNICDMEVPIEELANMPINPLRVIVIENLITGIAIEDLESTVAIIRVGYNNPVLAEITWFVNAPYRYYWGDIDTNSFNMLGLLRTKIQIHSLMMTNEIFEGHIDHHSLEEAVKPINADFEFTKSELELYQLLLDNHRQNLPNRLEQEYINWPLVCYYLDQID